MKVKYILTTVSLLLSALLCGCGRDETLQKYYDEMNSFITQAEMDFAVLEEIDPLSETAVPDLLECVDGLSLTFRELAEIEVPEQFSAIESLADDADQYMSNAAELFHQAYEKEPFGENYFEAATENYARAVRRMEYISDLLQGKVPNDANVTVIDESEGIGFAEDQPEEAEE